MTEKRIEDLQRGEWQLGNTYPSVPGVYERDFANPGGYPVPVFCKWDGEKWFFHARDVDTAALERLHSVVIADSTPWRGQIEVKP